MLSAPAFQPTPESQTYFIPEFRAYQYAGLVSKHFGAGQKFRLAGGRLSFCAVPEDHPEPGRAQPAFSTPPSFDFDYFKTLSSIAMTRWSAFPLGRECEREYYSPRTQPFSFPLQFGYISSTGKRWIKRSSILFSACFFAGLRGQILVFTRISYDCFIFPGCI